MTREDEIVRNGAANRRPPWVRHGAELCLIALFLLTLAVIGFQHRLFGQDILINQATAHRFAFDGYADQVSGGASTITEYPKRPLSWSCDLREGVPSLFCGHEAVLDGNATRPGVDLRTLESMRLTLDYHGPAQTLRLYLKNHDPRYSKQPERSTAKVNKVEFSVHEGRQTLVFTPQDFSVADWWLSGKNFAPEMGRTQLDNVVAVEVASGSLSPPGHYDFTIHALELRRSAIAPAQLYLVILAAWAVLVGLYMLVRVQRARRDALEKEQAQAQARDALARAARAALDASQAKSDFLASMSHELRTPLNAVLGYAQLLQRSPLPAQQLAAVKTIHRSGAHLLSLITDILDISKIEAGKMELHCAPVELRGALASVVEMITVRAEEKGLVFSCAIADDVPEAVEADEKRLRQILLNLLSNAVKFTSEGRVALRVDLLSRDPEHATLRFEVQDTGAGIAEDELERIFIPFEQVGEVHRREGGTGLGLTISRQLAGLMGANIEVQSRLGQGTSFWFDVTFPLAEAPAVVAAGGAQIIGYAGQGRRVLVVDDHQANRDLLCDLLQPLGFAVEVACDGREAVRLAQLTRPDIILMDLKMPVMDGQEAIRLMRLIEPLKTVPILAVSANNADEAEVASKVAGADGFLSKPVDTAELLAAVGHALKLDWITAAPASARDAGQTAETPGSGTETEHRLRLLAAEDNTTNQMVLQAMLQSLDVDLQIVGNGADAVQAVKAGAFDLVLMDAQMPEMSGVEATRAIRRWEARGRRRRTPIVALSANSQAQHLAEYRAAGMDAHLEKPIEIEQLYGLLQRLAAGEPLDLPLAG